MYDFHHRSQMHVKIPSVEKEMRTIFYVKVTTKCNIFIMFDKTKKTVLLKEKEKNTNV